MSAISKLIKRRSPQYAIACRLPTVSTSMRESTKDRNGAIELGFAVASLVVDQVAVLSGLTVIYEPSTVLSAIAIGLLIARYINDRGPANEISTSSCERQEDK